MADIVRQVVEVEGPIHWEELLARIRSFWGLKRAGARIQDAVEKAINAAEKQRMVKSQGDFIAKPGAVAVLRDRSNVASPSLRKPEMLAPDELVAGLVAFVGESLGATVEEIVHGLSRQIGFKSTSAQLRQVIEDAAAKAVKAKVVVRDQELIRLPTKP
jgi:hypothetical protein